MRDTLNRFLLHNGVDPLKYHTTITKAWILAVCHFMNKAGNSGSADELIDAHPEILDTKIMMTHYSAEVLFSDEARAAFVQPDLDPIPRYEGHMNNTVTAKVQIQALITELYAIISGPVGHQPDWKREAELFMPYAHMIRTSVDEHGSPQATVMRAADYSENFEKIMAGQAFFEVEVQNIIEVFGNIAHAFSTYEAWRDAGRTDFIKRGINSIQFYNDGSCWRIVNMIWDDERPGQQMAARYFKGNT
jgi:hypothetical protein